MGMLCVCNEKMQRRYMSEAIFNKICTANNMDTYAKYISIYSKKFYELKNNVFLLLDNIRKIRELK